MKHYSQISEKECQRAESFSDRLSNLRAVIPLLEVAHECLEDEGLLLHGTLKEMREQVLLAIRSIEESYLEGL